MGSYNEYHDINQSQMGQMLNAANKRISELIKENNDLKYEIAKLKKQCEEYEHRKKFLETTDYER